LSIQKPINFGNDNFTATITDCPVTMKIQFYNTLTNQLEEFKPVEENVVRMYSCGPTVYDFAHIGNFRSFLFADLLRRFFEFAGYKVYHVMNITDVGHMTEDAAADGGGEDRMKVGGQRIKEYKKSGKVPQGTVENPDDPYQVAQFYTDAFLQDAKTLGYKIAFEYPERVPKATDYIQQMQAMIKKLIDRGHAYVGGDGVVYYSVESFDRYGELSGNTLEKIKSGAGGRVLDEDQAMKRHPADFMLWKADPSHIMKWDSPWGTGYPGWHIECSVMASDLLERDVIDIHTGGEDLIFPHHECEIAQSCGASGQDSFANYWIHTRFLFVEGKKMSKSAGTFYTVRDVMEGRFLDADKKPWGRAVHPAVLRFELIKSHYRSNLNFTAKGIVDSGNSVRRMSEFRQSLEEKTGGEMADVDLGHPVLKEFAETLADDMNISGAMGVVMPWISTTPKDPHEALAVFKKINSVLSIAPINEGTETETNNDAGDELEQEILKLCKELDHARAAKDFSSADAIRSKIRDHGFEVRTTNEGTVIQKKLV
jgi:cysteinyl-tRNA synthetase